MIERILEKLDRHVISMTEAIEQLTRHFISQGYSATSARYKAEMTIVHG